MAADDDDKVDKWWPKPLSWLSTSTTKIRDTTGQTMTDDDDKHERNKSGEAMINDDNDLMKKGAEEKQKNWQRLLIRALGQKILIFFYSY